MALKLITASTFEPVTRTEVKSFLRVDFSDDDSLIDDLIAAARDMAEGWLRRSILTQTWQYTLDNAPDALNDKLDDLPADWPWSLVPAGKGHCELPMPPLQAVSSVTYYDQSNVLHTFSTANYSVDTNSEPGSIFLNTGCVWPPALRPFSAFSVQYVAGWTTSSLVPAQIRLGIKQAVGFLYENRQAQDLPAGAKETMRRYRIERL